MGLYLMAVNKGYGYNKDGEDKKGNKEYYDCRFGYGGYKFLRDKIIKYLSNGKISTIEELALLTNNSVWHDDKTQKVHINLEEFELENQTNEKVLEYLKALEQIKNNLPKIYDCYAWLKHCDCDGEMPYKQLVPVISHLKEYILQNTNILEIEEVNELIECMQSAIDNKGKLYFC